MAEMEQALEATGADVESAIAAGLVSLGVDRDAVEIEVLDEGSRGVFGLGVREARVRLTPRLKTMPRPAPAVPAEPDFEPSRAVAPPVAEVVEPAVVEKGRAEIACGVLRELLTLMDMESAQVDVRRAEPAEDEREAPLVFNVHGPGADALIGYHGKTLAALQHITRLIVGRELGGRAWLVVDVEGFRARREKSLHRLAQRMAEQAVRTDHTVVLEPMPPHERRIVHLALRDHSRVETQSVGEGNRRKVTIIPRRQ